MKLKNNYKIHIQTENYMYFSISISFDDENKYDISKSYFYKDILNLKYFNIIEELYI